MGKSAFQVTASCVMLCLMSLLLVFASGTVVVQTPNGRHLDGDVLIGTILIDAGRGSPEFSVKSDIPASRSPSIFRESGNSLVSTGSELSNSQAQTPEEEKTAAVVKNSSSKGKKNKSKPNIFKERTPEGSSKSKAKLLTSSTNNKIDGSTKKSKRRKASATRSENKNASSKTEIADSNVPAPTAGANSKRQRRSVVEPKVSIKWEGANPLQGRCRKSSGSTTTIDGPAVLSITLGPKRDYTANARPVTTFLTKPLQEKNTSESPVKMVTEAMRSEESVNDFRITIPSALAPQASDIRPKPAIGDFGSKGQLQEGTPSKAMSLVDALVFTKQGNVVTNEIAEGDKGQLQQATPQGANILFGGQITGSTFHCATCYFLLAPRGPIASQSKQPSPDMELPGGVDKMAVMSMVSTLSGCPPGKVRNASGDCADISTVYRKVDKDLRRRGNNASKRRDLSIELLMDP